MIFLFQTTNYLQMIVLFIILQLSSIICSFGAETKFQNAKSYVAGRVESVATDSAFVNVDSDVLSNIERMHLNDANSEQIIVQSSNKHRFCVINLNSPLAIRCYNVNDFLSNIDQNDTIILAAYIESGKRQMEWLVFIIRIHPFRLRLSHKFKNLLLIERQ